MNPTVLEDGVLLLGGLAFCVAVRRCEVSFGLGDGGPEESACVGPREVHRYVEVVTVHWHKVARVVAVVHEEGGAGLARLHLRVYLALERLVARVLLVFVARVARFGGNALRPLLDDFHEWPQQCFDAAVLHLFTVVFVLVHRVVCRDDVFVVGVIRHVESGDS